MQTKQNSQYDPRFYFIKILSISDFCPQENANQRELVLKLQLGNKHSVTVIHINPNDKFTEKSLALISQQLNKEVHIFKYGGEEFLNIDLQEMEIGKTDKGDKNDRTVKNISTAYSRILLPPLLELPHVKHKLNVSLVNKFVESASSDKNYKVGKLDMELYFQFNFKGAIEIIPVSANLQRNIAEIGQMKPVIELKLEDQSWTSLEAETGIKPCWSGHFYAKRNESTHKIENVQENILRNKELAQNRYFFLQQNSIQKYYEKASKDEQKEEKVKPYFDCTSFDMHSAGSTLSISLYSQSLFGSKLSLIGSTDLRLENQGFLKYPRLQDQNEYGKKEVELHYKSGDQVIYVGVLGLFYRFVFDKTRVTAKSSKSNIYALQ